MKNKFYRILSIALFLTGLYLIEPQTAGAVIGLFQTSNFGIILILFSGILFAVSESLERKVKNIAKRFLEQRRIPTKAKELRSIADKMGYTLQEGRDHILVRVKTQTGYSTIEAIPRHKIKRNTARRILKKLSRYATAI